MEENKNVANEETQAEEIQTEDKKAKKSTKKVDKNAELIAQKGRYYQLYTGNLANG